LGDHIVLKDFLVRVGENLLDAPDALSRAFYSYDVPVILGYRQCPARVQQDEVIPPGVREDGTPPDPDVEGRHVEKKGFSTRISFFTV